ncbi:RagB/SusD family nutrient uptake outer membrane protein [Marinilongibacter aquaticus]|uniref:RagB/SusD family nutrient uptake outer membrane protein n=1 Tax=Marinilongibacter aquaticus TaxID=2975157 RepID=UPI0021BDEB3B|nr:RagB/SusD family nutrient uptake outer membrane protein [Marinilongibacter aquaticus]UBM59149.1 RagB/SusD family nutrient uptake outer membrane protein [Marinilongibacter aquaticus]
MKNTLYISFISLFILTGCTKDFLDTEPFGQSTSDQFWRNADDAVAAANALYEPMIDEEFYGHSEQTFEICSDDFWRAGDHGEDQAIEDFTFDPGNSQLRHSYTFKYEIINRAHAILINVPDITMEQSVKDRVLGEAYFMRGFARWRQHVIYGALPIITEENYINNEFNQPKPTVAEFQAAIEADWLKAAELLPASYSGSDVGRPTSGTVNGFLAKLYLYMGDLDKAINAGEKVVNGPYALAENFADNFTIATENNPEVLFAVQSLDNWKTQDYMIYSTPRPWGGWDFHEPIQDLVDEFENNDPRLGFTIFKPGDMVDLGGDEGLSEYQSDFSQTGYHFRKFASWRETGGLDGDQNIPILRSADVYLLVAEAKIRRDGNGAGDNEINAIRQRVGLSSLSGADMSDLIHERRVELAGENQRFADLKRWDKAGIIDITSHFQIDRGQFKPSRNFQKPKHYYFAIPQREIDLSGGVIEQNEGY